MRLDLKNIVKMEVIKRLSKALDYLVEGALAAAVASTFRVRGPEQVSRRNRLALQQLYWGRRNAGRQISRMMRDIGKNIYALYEVNNQLNLEYQR